MTKIISLLVYLFSSLLLYSCKAHNTDTINSRNKDIIVFKIDTKKIKNKYSDIYVSNYSIEMVNHSENEDMGYSKFKYFKYFSFIHKRDTMNIECQCIQKHNYYFKNLDFQRGNYKLNFEIKKEKLFGRNVITQKEVQNILFKDIYVSDKKFASQDAYLKDIEFYEVDFKDTINVKLKRIE